MFQRGFKMKWIDTLEPPLQHLAAHHLTAAYFAYELEDF